VKYGKKNTGLLGTAIRTPPDIGPEEEGKTEKRLKKKKLKGKDRKESQKDSGRFPIHLEKAESPAPGKETGQSKKSTQRKLGKKPGRIPSKLGIG